MHEQKNNQEVREDEKNVSVSLADHDELIHDLRNLLAPILIHSQILVFQAENAGNDADAIRKSAVAIEKSIKAMVALLSNK